MAGKSKNKIELTAEEIEMLLKDIPYFHSVTSFCLGKNLKDAGEIVAEFFLKQEK